jgi:serine/alanine adding enzyme
MKLLEFSQLPAWDRFVAAHPRGSIFHTSCMIKGLAAARNQEPFAYAAVDSQGAICALLVATRVITIRGIGLPFAARSIMHAEPIHLPTAEGGKGLKGLLALHDQYMSSRALFCEIRPVFATTEQDGTFREAGYEKAGYLNYEVELDSNLAEMFASLGAKRRNNIRSAERKGVEVYQATEKQDLEDFYKLICASYARSRVPVAEYAMFDATIRCLPPDAVRVFTARYQSKPVASGCFLGFNGRVTCWYAGTLKVPGVPAMTSVFWHAMQAFALDGYQIFDLAGGGWEGDDYGPGKFKSKFGGHETNFGRYRKIYSPWKLSLASAVYDRVRKFVSPKVPTDFSGPSTHPI